MHMITYRENANFREVCETLPLFLDVIMIAHHDHMFQLAVMEVTRSQRHHQVT